MDDEINSHGTDPNNLLDFPSLALSWKWLAACVALAGVLASRIYRHNRT